MVHSVMLGHHSSFAVLGSPHLAHIPDLMAALLSFRHRMGLWLPLP